MTGIFATRVSRRSALRLGAGMGVALLAPERPVHAADSVLADTGSVNLLKRPIPHGGEGLPVIGVGTSRVFDVGTNVEDRARCVEVVRALLSHGGSVLDTAPSYGSAESVVGSILADTGLRSRVFLATKLERYEPGHEAAELRDSLQRMRTDTVDLLQLHNVRDPRQDLGGIRALKAAGTCRYTGITTTSKGAYEAAEAILEREKPDFLEIDYAIDNRDAENRVLPAAVHVGAAVLVALPFGRGRVFRLASGRPLPDWSAEFDCLSWPDFFLKYLLGSAAVTALIPGTGNAAHMIDDLGAGIGRLPDAAMRTRMVKYIESLS